LVVCGLDEKNFGSRCDRVCPLDRDGDFQTPCGALQVCIWIARGAHSSGAEAKFAEASIRGRAGRQILSLAENRQVLFDRRMIESDHDRYRLTLALIGDLIEAIGAPNLRRREANYC